MKRIFKRLAVGSLVLLVCLAGAAWVILTWVLVRPPSYSPSQLKAVELRSWPQHDTIYRNTAFPYIVSFENQNGCLEYIGAQHRSDAADPQLKEIEGRWESFKPTVAFCEGRARMFRFAKRNETGNLSESELVRILAYRNSIPLYSLEPTYEDEVAGLLTAFEPKLVASYLTIRVFAAEANQDGTNEDALASRLLAKRTNVDGLQDTFSSVGELDQFWKKEFPDAPDWRTLPNTEGVPLLRKVGDVSREIRGQHMVSSLVELVNKGERVFAVVGASHVIRQELELRRLLNTDSE